MEGSSSAVPALPFPLPLFSRLVLPPAPTAWVTERLFASAEAQGRVWVTAAAQGS